MHRTITVSTLADYQAGDYRLWASCEIDHTCRHSAGLDLDVLIERFGADFDVVKRRAELVAVLRCGKCGRKGVQIRLSPPASSGTGGAHGTHW